MDDILTSEPGKKTSLIYNWKFWVGLSLAILLIAWIVVTFIYKPKTSTKTKPKTRRKVYYEDEDDDYTSEEEEDIPTPPRQRRRQYSTRTTNVEPRIRSNVSDVRQKMNEVNDRQSVNEVTKIEVPNVIKDEFKDITLPSNHIIDTSDDVLGPARPNRNIDFTPQVPVYANHTGRQPERWKREGECRRILENIYSVPFPKAHPDWLINDLTGHRMELDGYNEELQIAFEHMGKQHYDPDDRYNKSDEEYKQMIYRDNLKANLCEQHDVYLIVIPYNIKFEELENYIRYNLPEAVAARQSRQQQLSQGTTPNAVQHFQSIVPKPIIPIDTEPRASRSRGINVPSHMIRR